MSRIETIKKLLEKSRAGDPEYQLETEEGESLVAELEYLEYQKEIYIDSILDER